MALQHLRSSTANKRPVPGNMSDGQLGINTNTASPGLFFKDSNNTLVKVGPVHVGTTAPNASPAVGGTAGNSVGEQWLDTTGGTYVFKVWDGTAWRSESGTFVDVNGDVMTGALGIIAGSAAAPGLYISGDTNSGLYSPGADQVSLTTGGTERLRIDSTGQIEAVSIGTAAAPVFSFTGDPNTGLYSPGADQLALSTAGTGRLFVDSAGLVGIGTSAPDTALHLASTSPVFRFENPTTTSTTGTSMGKIEWETRDASAPGVIGYIDVVDSNNFGTAFDMQLATGISGAATTKVTIKADGKVGIGTTSPGELLEVAGNIHLSGADRSIFNRSNNALTFGTNNTERVRIDSAGRLLVGTSTVRPVYTTFSGPLQAEGTTNSSRASSFVYNANDAADVMLVLGKSRSTVVGGVTAVQVNDLLGRVSFHGANGSALAPAADLRAEVDTGTVSTSSMPGRLVFTTTADGASSPTERMRITSAGRVGIGNSSPGVDLEIGAVAGSDRTMNIRSAGAMRGVFSTNASLGEFYIGATNDSSTGNLVFQTGSALAERLRIDSSGRVGIGTASPASTLHVNGTTSAYGNGAASLFWGNTSSLGALTYSGTDVIIQATGSSSGNLLFLHGSNERARIDSSGRLLVGTSTSLDLNAPIQAASTTFGVQSFRFSTSATGTGGAIDLSRSNSGTVGTTAAIVSGQGLGIVRFRGAADGSTYLTGAQIEATSDGGTVSATSMPTRLVFTTTADGASSPTERMRITSAGLVSIGGVSPVGILTVAESTTDGEITLRSSGGAGNNNRARLIFGYQSGGSNFGGYFAVNTTTSQNINEERLRITSDGYVRLSTSSPGIQFGGDTAAANALDDYEEGTFTPSIVGTTTAGTATYGANGQVGRYTKIGNRVFFDLYLAWSAHTGTGDLQINGLPFTVQNTTNLNRTFSAIFSSLTLTAGSIGAAFSSPNTTTIALRQLPTGGGSVATVPMDTSAQISISGSFDV